MRNSLKVDLVRKQEELTKKADQWNMKNVCAVEETKCGRCNTGTWETFIVQV